MLCKTVAQALGSIVVLKAHAAFGIISCLPGDAAFGIVSAPTTDLNNFTLQSLKKIMSLCEVAVFVNLTESESHLARANLSYKEKKMPPSGWSIGNFLH